MFLKEGHLYGELFVHCLLHYNMLCLGVYRFRDLQQQFQKNSPTTGNNTPSSKRFVICNPNADFLLMQTDLVYVLQQFDSNSRKKITNPLPKIPDNLKAQNLSLLKTNKSKNFNESVI